ncbi:uncharacterized protein VTP21DRAFT_9375 [Calcarisporiella thermophila]|uniref:uncharacterized protein n=1 Tax=Calcarisporiella thermophila TaxID=911321 RepID=UPI0037437AB9
MDGGAKSGRPPKVKNKNPAPIQITAEQILREAKERQEAVKPAPRQKISDLEELSEYRQRKRKEYEDIIRRNRLNVGNWLKYAKWEESQKELDRARSVYERALDVEPRNTTLYLHYCEMEMKNRNVNHARNLFDRAVRLLPRVDQLWFKYVYMEEMLGNISGAREIFERWMQWEPAEDAWLAYVKMEKRYGETERARAIYERFVSVHPEPKNWLKWAHFEEDFNDPERVRSIYQRATEYLGDAHADQRVFIAFAKFETKMREYDRARVIYKYALERLPRSKSEALYKQYTNFERQYGERDEMEDVIIGKRRIKYEEELKENPKNYDVWFDYARLEEGTGDAERVREVYERAIAQAPPLNEKRFWRRYIYLWINYALYEELETRDYTRTRDIYTECLRLIPHKEFTFAKIWLLYAQFEVRQLNLSDARKALGRAIGMCPKDKLFKGYIELEMSLKEFDRVRTLYTKYLEYNPANCATWIQFAELEHALEETERARAIFELAVKQPVLDMPEVLWKGYIDFEFEEEEYQRTRQLYERLLERTSHVKVWNSYARFELSVPAGAEGEGEDELSPVERARNVYNQAYKRMKDAGLQEDRVLLLEAWREFEAEHGTEAESEAVKARMPRVIKKRRRVEGAEGQFEEYYEYVFPDDEARKPVKNLLDMAYRWKQQMQQDDEDDDEEEGDHDEEEAAEDGEDGKEREAKRRKENDEDDD